MRKPSKPEASYYHTKAVVLGASGFIGRWVARGLGERGARVSLVVRNKSLAEPIFASCGISGDVFELDLEHLDSVVKLLQKIKPAIVFNLSGYGMSRSERDIRAAYQINARLVQALLETVAKTRNPRWPGQDIVHVGTPLEYGTIDGNLSEDSIPRPTTLYGISKLAGTELVAKFSKSYNIKGLTARPFTVYGPGEPAGRLLPSLIAAAKTGSALCLTSGEQKRDFVYVEDVSEGLLRLGLSQAGGGEVVNLATGRLTAVRVFAETAAKIMGIPGDRLKFGAIPPLAEEMHHSEVSTEQLRKLTAWTPATAINEGIRKTIERLWLQSPLISAAQRGNFDA